MTSHQGDLRPLLSDAAGVNAIPGVNSASTTLPYKIAALREAHQQMRWSRRGADLLLQVRCAVYNGTLSSGIGHRFEAFGNPEPVFAMAAFPPNLWTVPGSGRHIIDFINFP